MKMHIDSGYSLARRRLLLGATIAGMRFFVAPTVFANDDLPIRFLSTLDAYPGTERADLITALPIYLNEM